MRHFKIGKFITGFLVIFVLSCIFPSCATTNVTEADTTRQSLLMVERSGHQRGKKQVSSREYKKRKKKNNMYKKKKHKYKKKRGKSRTRRRR
jgi:hypothetical protein